MKPASKSFVVDKYGYDIDPEEIKRQRDAHKFVLKQAKAKSKKFLKRMLQEKNNEVAMLNKSMQEYDARNNLKLEQ